MADEIKPPETPAVGVPPVNRGYVKERIAAADARKEKARPGSSKPMRAS
jgi:hypothetical protein